MCLIDKDLNAICRRMCNILRHNWMQNDTFCVPKRVVLECNLCRFVLQYGLFCLAIWVVSQSETSVLGKRRGVFIKIFHLTRLSVSYFVGK